MLDAGNSAPKGTSSALVRYCPPSVTAEEAERRRKEAEELEEKLKAVQENVPTRVYNVCGSAAGAGSGDFHQYRMIRRREQMRLRRIEEEAVKVKQQHAFEAVRDKRRLEDEAKTAKRRAKRLKRKERKKGGKVAEQREATSNDDNQEQPPQAALD